MITKDQIITLSKKYKINETSIFREYLQVLFLSKLYSFPKSSKIFFKGGTALHLIYKMPRFSEDLDFTCELKEKEFLGFIGEVFAKLSKEEDVEFKERKTITGKSFLLTANPTILPYTTFVNLDFSFREKVVSPQKSIIGTDYPLLFTSYIYHLSSQEIGAEKIRAILTRKKGRDLYDLWFLLNRGVVLDDKLIRKKLIYYGFKKIKNEQIFKRVEEFTEEDFILDLRPFVPIPEREKLASFFVFLKDYFKKKLLANKLF